MQRTVMDWNKPLLLRYRTSRLERWSNCASVVWTMLCGLTPHAKLLFVVILLMLAVMLIACTPLSMPSSAPAKNPLPPPTELSESPPTYLQTVRDNISKWQKALQELIPKQGN